MSLISLDDGWKRFGSGRKWRCVGPKYRCEVDDAGNTPNYLTNHKLVAKIRRIKAFYAGRLKLGRLDEHGTGIDFLVANSLAESLGTVPSPLSTAELRGVYNGATGTDPGVKMDHVVRYVACHANMLERREPGYHSPLGTPGRVSLGSHHVLVSTAHDLMRALHHAPSEGRIQETADLVCRMPSDSPFAAQMAIQFLNDAYHKHLNQPPLMAATYNAGSPRPDARNLWNLRQYGNHVDRWIAYYNTSRMS